MPGDQGPPGLVVSGVMLLLYSLQANIIRGLSL